MYYWGKVEFRFKTGRTKGREGRVRGGDWLALVRKPHLVTTHRPRPVVVPDYKGRGAPPRCLVVKGLNAEIESNGLRFGNNVNVVDLVDPDVKNVLVIIPGGNGALDHLQNVDGVI